MTYALLLEKIAEPGFPSGYYYAHIPTLGLTTQGLGVEGARAAALELVDLWIAEKRSHGEPVPLPGETLLSSIELPVDALQSS